MSRLLSGTRYLIIVPIIGLAMAATVFFVFGGFGLISLLVTTLLHGAEAHSEIPFEVEIVEYVHTFLIGTVLYITAVG
ncbi:MAG: YqhA family protein, partial [Chloroflexota bacterium]